MVESIDVVRVGERLRRVRVQRGLTLREVAGATGISVATLSRIERGACNDLGSGTLVALSEWLATPVEELTERAAPPIPARGRARETPEIVELYLRADKKLNKRTASALGRMFRAAYEAFVNQSGEK